MGGHILGELLSNHILKYFRGDGEIRYRSIIVKNVRIKTVLFTRDVRCVASRLGTQPDRGERIMMAVVQGRKLGRQSFKTWAGTGLRAYD